jgi:RNA polymerase sigma-70 factor (ECF subfamily)
MPANVTPFVRPEAAPRPPFPGPDPEGVTAQNRWRVAGALARAAADDRSAFRDLYALTSRLVFGIVLAIVRKREIAEEVTQDAYLCIWRRAASYDPAKGNPLAWIAAIARNRAIDRLRAEQTRGFVTADDELPEIDDGIDHAGRTVESMTVRRLLAGLRPEHRQALLLAYFRGYTNTELAAVLGVPVGTVKSWLRRGLIALKEALE